MANLQTPVAWNSERTLSYDSRLSAPQDSQYDAGNTDSSPLVASTDEPDVYRSGPLNRSASRRGKPLAVLLGRGPVGIVWNSVTAIMGSVWVAFAIWALITRHDSHITSDNGTLHTGNCRTVSRLNAGIHALINVAATGLLGNGLYWMQVLAAPTVDKLGRLHSQGRSVQIGVNSIRNIWHLGWSRVFLWLILGLSSVLIHFSTNAAVFTSTPFVIYPLAGVTSDYLTAKNDWTNNWNHASMGALEYNISLAWKDLVGYPSILQLPRHLPTFQVLNNSACIEAFISPLNTTRELVLVLNETSASFNASGSSLLLGDLRLTDTGAFPRAPNWICYYAHESVDTSRGQNPTCNLAWARKFENDWKVRGRVAAAPPPGQRPHWPYYDVKHCLVGEAADQSARCSLLFDRDLLIFSMACITCQVVAVLIVVYRFRIGALIHSGDVVAECVKGNLKPATTRSSGPSHRSRPSVTAKTQPWIVQSPPRWFHAVPLSSWLFAMFFILGGIAIGILCFVTAMASLTLDGITLRQDMIENPIGGNVGRWNIVPGLNEIFDLSPQALDVIAKHPTRINAIIANLPQIVLSLVYVACCNVLSRQLVAHAIFKYMTKAKHLRVTEPEISFKSASPHEPRLQAMRSRLSRFFNDISKWWIRSKKLRMQADSTELDGLHYHRNAEDMSLPKKYMYTLAAAKAALHWLFSQSLFVVQVSAWGPGPTGVHIPDHDTSRIAWSTMSILVSIIVGVSLTIIFLGHSLRRFPAIPKAFPQLVCDSNTLALLSLPNRSDQRLHLSSLRLGVVQQRRDDASPEQYGLPAHVYRIGFGAAGEVRLPVSGRMYVQPVWTKPSLFVRLWRGTRSVLRLRRRSPPTDADAILLDRYEDIEPTGSSMRPSHG